MHDFDFSRNGTLHDSVLVSDFDGTLAHPDFYQLVKSRLVPANTPNYWKAYQTGEITHFAALQKYFAAAEGGEAAFLRLLDDVSLPERLPEMVQRLARNGWSVVIVSAGCQWYIDLLLQRAGAELPVITNPGQFEGGRLRMTLPENSPFFSEENGVNKSAVVTTLLDAGKSIAYCGDGLTDHPAAKLVRDEFRFARADLAEACKQEKLAYRPFEVWDDVVNALIDPQSKSSATGPA